MQATHALLSLSDCLVTFQCTEHVRRRPLPFAEAARDRFRFLQGGPPTRLVMVDWWAVVMQSTVYTNRGRFPFFSRQARIRFLVGAQEVQQARRFD